MSRGGTKPETNMLEALQLVARITDEIPKSTVRCVCSAGLLGLFASDGSIHLKQRQVSGAVAIGW